MCESMCDTLSSSAANQGDNTVSVAQGGYCHSWCYQADFATGQSIQKKYISIYTPDQLKADITLAFVHLHFSAVCDLKMRLLTAVDLITTVSWFCVITRERWFRVHIIHVEILSISVIYSVCFPSVLSFLCVTAQKHSRQTSYIILLKDVICWSMGLSRWVVSKKKAPGLSLSR